MDLHRPACVATMNKLSSGQQNTVHFVKLPIAVDLHPAYPHLTLDLAV